MLQKTQRMKLNGNTVSINQLKIEGHVDNLAMVLQMLGQILNVDAIFGIFLLPGSRCLVIGRSHVSEIDIGRMMRYMTGGGHPGAGSALLKDVAPATIAAWIRILIGGNIKLAGQVRNLMSAPAFTFPDDISMATALKLLRKHGYHGAPVVKGNYPVGIISQRDFKKIKKQSQYHLPIKAFMSRPVRMITPEKSPADAAYLMVKYDIGRLPVVEKEQLIGIITRTDAMADFYGLCPLPDDTI